MPRDVHRPISALDAKEQAIIDLVLSDKGGRMSIGQVANLFSVENKAVMHVIRIHATSSDGCRRHSWRNEFAQEVV